MGLPERSESVEPFVHLPQRGRTHRVHTARTILAHGGEPVVTQNFQMLRNGGLSNSIFALHDRGDRTRRDFPVSKQFEYASPNWVTENIKSVHVPTIQRLLI